MNNLEKIEALATQIFVEEFSEKFVYHNLDYQKGLIEWVKIIGEAEQLSENEMSNCQIAAWLVYTGFRDLGKFGEIENNFDLFEKCIPSSLEITKDLLKTVGVNKKDKEIVLDLIDCSSLKHNEELTTVQRVFKDALRGELTSKDGYKNIKTLYREFLLVDAITLGKSDWLDMSLQFLYNFQYLSEYGKNELQPKLEKLIKKVENESKKFQKQRDFALKRELEVSDSELKQLKKNLTNSKGRDDRGIQTMFRSTSKNHYTLNAMVDKKASIMISVNAIILSLIIGGAFQKEGMSTGFSLEMLPNICMMITAIFLFFLL